ncbi:hypothetical protein PFISCL1PPCAC_20290, partial [Pristionchus fissidentatus]
MRNEDIQDALRWIHLALGREDDENHSACSSRLVSSILNHIAKLKYELEQRKSDVCRYKKELKSSNAEWTQEIVNLESELETARREVKECREEVETSREQIELLTRKLRHSENEVNRCEELKLSDQGHKMDSFQMLAAMKNSINNRIDRNSNEFQQLAQWPEAPIGLDIVGQYKVIL